MRKNIEEYIEKSKYMENKSQGGAPAYLFDDVVLIKYPGIREDEKLIAEMANKKRKQGTAINGVSFRKRFLRPA